MEHINNIIEHQIAFIRKIGKPITVDNKSYLEISNFSQTISFKDLQDSFWIEHVVLADNIINGFKYQRHNINYHLDPANTIIVDDEPFYGYEYCESIQKYLNNAIDHLNKDSNTRRAVIHFTNKDGKETQPCLMSLQFLVRDNKLDVYSTFRSWNLRKYGAYDLAIINQISHFVSQEIGIILNNLYINVTSAHDEVNIEVEKPA